MTAVSIQPVVRSQWSSRTEEYATLINTLVYTYYEVKLLFKQCNG